MLRLRLLNTKRQMQLIKFTKGPTPESNQSNFTYCNHSIQINHQLDATISPVFYLTFIYSSTCFGRPHIHHQELNKCSSSPCFYLRSVVITVLLIVVHDQHHCHHHATKVKPEAATAVVELLMMDVRTSETC
jgi:hypothetical protein